jgi:MOSC domain-containing protein YiiM
VSSGHVRRDNNQGVTDAKGDTARLVSVHVGRPRLVPASRTSVRTAIWKNPVAGRVAVRGVNLAGDDQADRSVHGGPDKAVYAYAQEEIQVWTDELGRDLGEAAFGQNLTTRGVAVSSAVIGERWRVGTTLLEVAQPRVPCHKLALRFGEAGFVKRFAQAARPGAYLRIVEEGELAAGDAIDVIDRPDHQVTSRMVFDAMLRDHTLIPQVVAAQQLPAELREWLARRVAD